MSVYERMTIQFNVIESIVQSEEEGEGEELLGNTARLLCVTS